MKTRLALLLALAAAAAGMGLTPAASATSCKMTRPLARERRPLGSAVGAGRLHTDVYGEDFEQAFGALCVSGLRGGIAEMGWTMCGLRGVEYADRIGR